MKTKAKLAAFNSKIKIEPVKNEKQAVRKIFNETTLLCGLVKLEDHEIETRVGTKLYLLQKTTYRILP